MRMDTPVANGDPTLAGLLPEGVTLAHIIALFQTAYHVNGEQLLRARLSAWCDPPGEPCAPRVGRIHQVGVGGAKVGRDQRPRRRACIWSAARGRSGCRQTRVFGRDWRCRGRTEIRRACPGHDREQLIDTRLEPDKSLHTGRRKPRTSGRLTSPPRISCRGRLPILKRALLRRPLLATRSLSTADTFSASVALLKMLGRHPRTLQRWRKKGKGPAFTKIGRKVFYELNDLQEWIDRGKIR